MGFGLLRLVFNVEKIILECKIISSDVRFNQIRLLDIKHLYLYSTVLIFLLKIKKNTPYYMKTTESCNMRHVSLSTCLPALKGKGHTLKVKG